MAGGKNADAGEQGTVASGQVGNAMGQGGSASEQGTNESGLITGFRTNELSHLMKSTKDSFGRSVVRIVVKDARDEISESATAFAAYAGKTRRLFMTVRHNFDGIDEQKEGANLKPWMRLSGEDGTDYPIYVAFKDDESDLAIFTVSFQDLSSEVDIPALEFSNEEIGRGMSVVTLGFSCPTCTLHIIKGSRPPKIMTEQEIEVLLVKEVSPFPGKIGVPPYARKGHIAPLEIKYSSPTTRGCSGSPVMLNGKVAGVHVENDMGERICRHYSSVKEVLKKWLGNEDVGEETFSDLFAKLDLKITNEHPEA